MAFAASTCVMAQLRRLLRVDPNDRGTEQSLAWWRIGLPETGALRAHDTTRAELVTWRSQQKVGM